MTEHDVGKIVQCTAYEEGADWVLPGHIMCGADKEGMIDTGHHFDGMTINEGDYLSLDMPLSYKGYWADMGRIINVGPASESYMKTHEEMWKVFEAGVDAAKPGVKAKEVWQAMDNAMKERGFSSMEMFGHGIGLDIHEPPVLGKDSETVLQPGMTFEMESAFLPGLRKYGGMGAFHVEDLVIITERGCNVVVGLPRNIVSTSLPAT
jgi:Xaa-Pro aminopeptidase